MDTAFDAAACIGCGACVAACPNASAMLFTAAKVAHLGVLPQGQPERDARVRSMVAAMDAERLAGRGEARYASGTPRAALTAVRPPGMVPWVTGKGHVRLPWPRPIA